MKNTNTTTNKISVSVDYSVDTLRPRKLLAAEREIVVTTSKRHNVSSIAFNDSTRVSSTIVGNFTIVNLWSGKRMYTGVAKRNPSDTPNYRDAFARALSRAVASNGVLIPSSK
jgi:hypothetical protein